MLRPLLTFLAAALAGGTWYLRQHLRHQRKKKMKDKKSEEQWRLINEGLVVGLDIGGTLAKIALFEPDSHTSTFVSKVVKLLEDDTTYGSTGKRDTHLSFYVPTLRGRFHLIRFKSARVPNVIGFVSRHGLQRHIPAFCTTGGGAFKYEAEIQSKLQVTILPVDELDACVCGLSFILHTVKDEAFTYVERSRVPRPLSTQSSLYPFLLVNVGSGVSIIRVDSEKEWVRVSGTSLGGGTFSGLGWLLTGVDSFDELLDLAGKGDNTSVDLTVGDIYGGDYSNLGLPADLIASNFGKAHDLPPPLLPYEPHPHRHHHHRHHKKHHHHQQQQQTPRHLAALPNMVQHQPNTPAAPSTSGSEDEDGALHRPSSVQSLPALSSSREPAPALFIPTAHTPDPDPGRDHPHRRRPRQGSMLLSRKETLAASATRHIQLLEQERWYDSQKTRRRHLPSVHGRYSGSSVDQTEAFSPTTDEDVADAHHRHADIARALLMMISNNLGQVAYLNALRHGCSRIYFAGNFFHHANHIAMRALAFAIRFWSKNKMEALFLRHEGYFGAVGAFIATMELAVPKSDIGNDKQP